MTDPRGFLAIQRRLGPYRPIDERLRDYGEQHAHAPEGLVREQAQRCMDCGIPFCHQGCPLGNLIPDWNDLVSPRRWLDRHRAAAPHQQLPRVHWQALPRPLRGVVRPRDQRRRRRRSRRSSSRSPTRDPEGWVVPQPPSVRPGRSVGVVGSGPAGLACAQQLARAGHAVTVYERDDRPGGLLRYGIPDFKIDKRRSTCGSSSSRPRASRSRAGRVRRRPRTRRAARPARRGRARNRRAAAAGPEPARTRASPASTSRCRTSSRRTGGSPASRPSDRAHGRGQAGRDPRRRRHLRGLPRECPARRRHLRDRDRPRPHAAARANAAADVARVAGTAALLPGARRGRRAPVGDRDRGVRRTGRTDRVVAGAPRSSTRSTPRRARGGAFPSRTSHSTSDLVLLAIGFVGIEPQDGLAEGLGVGITARGTVEPDRGLATGVDGVFACGDCVRGADLIVTAIADGRLRGGSRRAGAGPLSATPMV